MDLEKLFTELEKNKNADQSLKMSAYMQNKFSFLGIPMPKLRKIEKPFFKERKKDPIDWKFINNCWNLNYREGQYVALNYLNYHKEKLGNKDLPLLKQLIITKSWWDTIDAIDGLVGLVILKYPVLKLEMIKWAIDDNLWLRRVAIDFQQKYKEKTDTNLLGKIICANLGSSEFFINKAIGWSLREYSKINPQWVKSFIAKYNNNLSKLSTKEASKYLKWNED